MAFATPATLAGVPLTVYPHACALVDDPEDEASVVAPFIAEGLSEGDQVNVVYAPDRAPEVRGWFGADLLERTESSGQLQVRDWNDAHLRGGRFDITRTLEAVEEMQRTSRAAGWPRTRFIGHMGWTSPDRPEISDVIEYEARVNKVLADMWSPAICVYPMPLLSARTLVDLLAVHPVVYMSGTAVESPFFVPPDRFLQTRSRPSHGGLGH
ncbi:MAG TPA: MEDS domain-containing protein [Candidatus Limnocylindrales bacterium]|nr:MEDS domain-containing protein [Candidatus Limnocylindrales bacterium]